MARFNFHLGALHIQIDGREAAPLPFRRPLAAMVTAAEAGAAQPPIDGAGPGWFESSWELVRGVEVREGLPGDAQLHEWIEACLLAGPSPQLQLAVC